MNDHYRDAHPKLSCTVCSRSFDLPVSLRKHQYTHGKLEWTCRRCGKSYPFSSQLKAHKLLHGCHPDNKCIYPGCGKYYTYIWDLTKHAKTHFNTYKCGYKKCKYTNNDERNLKQHRRTHTKEKLYSCNKCGESFRFFMQKKRHLLKPKCKT